MIRCKMIVINTFPMCLQLQPNGWAAAGPSHALPSPAADPPLHMPVVVGGPAASPAPAPAPAPAPPPSEPDLSPEECPQYFAINSYLYRLHMERLRRQQGGQF